MTRVLLDRDADLVLGDVAFKADRAAVWLSPEALGAGRTRYHVFVLADRVRTPLGDPAVGLKADRLPISAVVEPDEAVRLFADARLDGPPGEFGLFIADAEAALGRTLRGEPEEPEAPPVDMRPVRPLTRLDAEAVPIERLGPSVEDALGVARSPVAPPSGPSGAEPPTPPPETPEQPAPAARDGSRVRLVEPARPTPTPAPTQPTPTQPTPTQPTPTQPTPTQPTPTQPVPGEPARVEPAPPRPAAPAPVRPSPAPAEAPTDAPAPRDDDRAAEPAEPDPPRDAAAALRRPLFTADGVFYVAAGDKAVVAQEADANTVSILGGVIVQYIGASGTLEIEADRAVVFLKPGPLRDALGALRPDDLEGLYLEGAVRATDGAYTLRGERLYYDVRQNRAIALDAVFWTYAEQLALPLYMRARVIRQEASDEFRAEKATFSNSAFFRPHFNVGTRSMTITRREDDEGDTRNIVDARHITLRAGRVPFFYWPWLRGDPERIPVRNATYRDSNREGFLVRTEWDPFVLLGIDRPAGVDAILDIDYFEERGFGVGLRSAWDTDLHRGDLTAYLLPDDGQDDIVGPGIEIARDNATRSLLIGRDRWQLRPEWALWAEIGYSSDETLTGDLFRLLGQTSDEIATRLHLRRLVDNTALSFEVRGAVNDFIINENTAQSPGYLVDKLPEVKLDVVAEDAAPFLPPGALTHTWEASVSSLRLRFPEVTAASIGYPVPVLSQRAFGVEPDQSVGDALRATGLNESFVGRLDTRHEITAPLKFGPLNVTPFAVGRFTGYDSDFPAFSPGETDNVRLWGAAGVRIATSFHRVDDRVESRTFDLHRIRHIIEPSVTVWQAETTVSARDLPIFDDDVEQLGEGGAVRLALDQTWQTKRGGPGRWRSVDVLKVSTEYVWADEALERGTPIGRWFDARPELGSPQRYGAASFVWRTSEVVSLLGEVIYDPDISSPSRSSVGVRLEPGRGFDALLGVRRLEAQDSTYLDALLGYTFGDKYILQAAAQYNFVLDQFQAYQVIVLRDFPVGQLGAVVSFDNIRETTSVGFQFRPLGTGRAFANDFDTAPLSRPGSLRR